MERLTEKRRGQNVIPLRQMSLEKAPLFALVKISDNTSFLYGDAANKLAAYEDTGYEPEEITALQEDNERLHKLLDNLEAVLTSKPPEHNSGNDDKVHCRNCDYLNMDSGKPYCCRPHMSTSGLDDWCDHTKRKEN